MSGITFERRLSLGNLITILMLAATIIVAWTRRETDVDNIGKELTEHKTRIAQTELRLAILETTSSSNQESLRWIKEALTRIEHEIKSAN